MLQIEPIEEVITKRKLIVTIDEDEIAKILVDPRPFQKMLRKQKTAWSGTHRNWASDGHATRPQRARKAAEKKTVKIRGVKCPKCHKVFKALGRHVASCTGGKNPLASVRVPSPLDE
jgi:hypothetical protein